MSGSFDDMDVPPTLVSFAIAPQDASRLISPEFKAAGHPVYFFDAPYNQDGTPDYTTLKFMWNEVANLIASGKAVSAWALFHPAVLPRVFARWRSATRSALRWTIPSRLTRCTSRTVLKYPIGDCFLILRN